MPKYTFECPKCGRSEQSYVPTHVKTISCYVCAPDKETWMKRKLPTLSGNPDITEVIDDYTGKTVKQDQSTMVKERHDKYYWGVEVPRMVKSGVYGVDTMLENGWIWFDDHNHMQIHDKPPSER